MAERRDFPHLLRRKRFLEQEQYTYYKYLQNTDDPKQQTKWALDAEMNNEELDEIDYVLRYFERLGNGYHLSRRQWLLIVSLVVMAVVLGVIAVVR